MSVEHALSVSRRVNAERLILVGWTRAILLQLAHPLVAAGVAGHSTFRDGGLAAASRLHQTIRAMRALTFGDAAEYARGIDGIRAIHRRVRGQLRDAVGPFAAGTPYSAEDPDLLLWVHATLLDSLPLAYGRFVQPLDVSELDAYCAEAASAVIALGARAADVPRSWAELERYRDDVLASQRLVIGPDARVVAAAVLEPPFSAAIRPLVWMNRLFGVGTLPDAVRRGYGFTWTPRDARRLARATGRIRAIRRVMPLAMAWWPEARRLPSARPAWSS